MMAIGSAWTCIAEDLRLEMVYELSCVRGFKVAAPPWGRTEQRDNFHPTGIWQTRANRTEEESGAWACKASHQPRHSPTALLLIMMNGLANVTKAEILMRNRLYQSVHCSRTDSCADLHRLVRTCLPCHLPTGLFHHTYMHSSPMCHTEKVTPARHHPK